MRIALIGTRGVPARYGGFETCIEEVGSRLAHRHEVTVYCRTPRQEDRLASYRGMHLVHLPSVPSKQFETLSHTALSVAHLVTRRGPDAAIVFNAANAPLLPALRARHVPVATHVDGLEWQRTKWSGLGKQYYRRAEAMAVRWSDALIADAQGIADYYTREFGAPTRQITYGAPRVDRDPRHYLDDLGLRPDGYHLVVARFEPENNLHTIVEGYVASGATRPLIIVGDAPYGDAYIQRVKDLADDRVRFLSSVWDQDLLDQLYANAFIYWHGHSVGGTNPSLLRAIGAATPSIAHDNVFNRGVLQGAGRYFTAPACVSRLIEAAEADPTGNRTFSGLSRERAGHYDWDDVAVAYEQLCHDLSARRLRRPGLSGRRRPIPTTVSQALPTTDQATACLAPVQPGPPLIAHPMPGPSPAVQVHRPRAAHVHRP